MDKTSKMGVGVIVVASIALAWWMLRPTPVDTPERVERSLGLQPDPRRTVALPKLAKPAVGEEERHEPPADGQQNLRPAPFDAREEGLFALADASGMSVARCRLDAYPEGFEHQDGEEQVVGDVFVTFLVAPTDGGEARQSFHPMEAYHQSIMNALVGGIGSCEVKPMTTEVTFVVTPVDAIDFETRAEEQVVKAEVVVADVEDEMLPEQVALEAPGLSDGARQWLQDRIDATEKSASYLAENPRSAEDLRKETEFLNRMLEEHNEQQQ